MCCLFVVMKGLNLFGVEVLYFGVDVVVGELEVLFELFEFGLFLMQFVLGFVVLDWQVKYEVGFQFEVVFVVRVVDGVVEIL